MRNEGTYREKSQYDNSDNSEALNLNIWVLIVIKSSLQPLRNSLLTDSKHGIKSFLFNTSGVYQEITAYLSINIAVRSASTDLSFDKDLKAWACDS